MRVQRSLPAWWSRYMFAGHRGGWLSEKTGLLALLLLGVVIRVSHAAQGPMWRDEAQLLNVVSLPSAAAIRDFLIAHESHPPLFYLLMRWWLQVAPPGELMSIAPGIVLGSATVLLTWWLGRLVAGPRAGGVAALLVTLSPRLIESATVARPYSTLTFVLLAAVALMWRAVSTGSRVALAGWAGASVALLYLHNWSALPVAATGLSALWLVVSRRSPLQAGPLILAGVAVFLGWLPWVPNVIHQAQHGGQLPPATSPLIRAPLHMVSSVPGLSIEAGVVLLAGVLGLALLRRSDWALSDDARSWLRLTTAIVLLTVALAAVGSFRTDLLVPHVLPVLAPMVLIIVAILLTADSSRGKLLAVATLCLVLGLSLHDAFGMARSPRSNADRVAQRVAREATEEDLVVLLPADLVSSFERHFSGRAPLFGYPEGEDNRPFEYNDRLAREADPDVLAAAAMRLERTITSGGRIWEVSAGVERHLKAPWMETGARLRAMGATVVVVPVDSSRRTATLEDIRLRVWRRLGR